MLLQRSNGAPFAAGATEYQYRPATERETTPRITVEVEIAGLRLTAFVDTGGIYFICPSSIEHHLGLDFADSVGQDRLVLRNRTIQGSLYRIPLTILASEGEEVTINATAFVPQDAYLDWGEFPCILGMQGCLERIRFAVDPQNEIFYFGELS